MAHLSRWHICLRDQNGVLLRELHVDRNLQPDEGAEWMLKTVFSEAESVPASYYIGLSEEVSSNIDEDTTLATITDGTDGTEASGHGYARQAVASDATDWTVSKVGEDWQAASKLVTFTATSDSIGPVDWCFLTTVVSGTSGKVVCACALSEEWTLLEDQYLEVSITFVLGE